MTIEELNILYSGITSFTVIIGVSLSQRKSSSHSKAIEILYFSKERLVISKIHKKNLSNNNNIILTNIFIYYFSPIIPQVILSSSFEIASRNLCISSCSSTRVTLMELPLTKAIFFRFV